MIKLAFREVKKLPKVTWYSVVNPWIDLLGLVLHQGRSARLSRPKAVCRSRRTISYHTRRAICVNLDLEHGGGLTYLSCSCFDPATPIPQLPLEFVEVQCSCALRGGGGGVSQTGIPTKYHMGNGSG